MGHGPKRLLRVSSTKTARSPIRTSSSPSLSGCWGKPIIISLRSSRHQPAMARQMGVEMGIQMSVLEANILFLIFYAIYIMTHDTHRDSEHLLDLCTMISPNLPVTVPPFHFYNQICSFSWNTKHRTDYLQLVCS